MVARHEDELAALRESGVGRLLSAAETADLVPVADAVGGAHLADDLQVDPREAAPAVAKHLAAEGVAFHWRTSALGIEPGILHTSRGEIRAATIVVAVGHDVDQLYPVIAEGEGIQRCALDMMLADGVGLDLPLLTGSSMLRYSAIAGAPSAADIRARLERQEPGVFAHDVNQMYTQRPDGTLIVGDTHDVGVAVSPFQDERAFSLLERLSADLFGHPLRMRQRWQGVYAKGPGDFLRVAPADGVRIVSVTTGIGMSTGLGLAESIIADLWG